MDARTLCLGTLMLGDASGYEIRKMFEEGAFAHFQAASFGSIYPALAKLLEDGLVDTVECLEDDSRDKKIYAVTDAGRRAFRESLKVQPGPDRIRSDAAFLMFFSDLLEPDHLRDVFDDYLAQYKERAALMKTLDPAGVPQGRLFVRGMGQAFYEAMIQYMEANRPKMFSSEATASDEAVD